MPMELFLLVSMVLTVVSFSLIVLSEPAAPSLAEHDSDLASEFAPEESMAETRESLLAPLSESTTPNSTATLAVL
jgi:hypothetical protein